MLFILLDQALKATSSLASSHIFLNSSEYFFLSSRSTNVTADSKMANNTRFIAMKHTTERTIVLGSIYSVIAKEISDVSYTLQICPFFTF